MSASDLCELNVVNHVVCMLCVCISSHRYRQWTQTHTYIQSGSETAQFRWKNIIWNSSSVLLLRVMADIRRVAHEIECEWSARSRGKCRVLCGRNVYFFYLFFVFILLTPPFPFRSVHIFFFCSILLAIAVHRRIQTKNWIPGARPRVEFVLLCGFLNWDFIIERPPFVHCVSVSLRACAGWHTD